MSEISVLSNQYEKLVSTSDKINNSVIAFKKKSLLQDKDIKRKHPKLTVSGQELDDAKVTLVSFLENIQNLMKEGNQSSDFIPSLIVNDYKIKLSSNQYIDEDLRNLIQNLKENKQVSDIEINVLDNILSILDKERNALFRKLRRARG